MELRHSVCALDCPDTCSLLVNVENGTATKLRGNPDHPVTRGFLCGKVARYLDREYSPQRLLYPRKRIGAKGEGRFTRIGWEEALATIASNLTAVADQIVSLWDASKQEVGKNRPELLGDFEANITRCTNAARFDRAADADKAYKNLDALVTAYFAAPA